MILIGLVFAGVGLVKLGVVGRLLVGGTRLLLEGCGRLAVGRGRPWADASAISDARASKLKHHIAFRCIIVGSCS